MMKFTKLQTCYKFSFIILTSLITFFCTNKKIGEDENIEIVSQHHNQKETPKKDINSHELPIKEIEMGHPKKNKVKKKTKPHKKLQTSKPQKTQQEQIIAHNIKKPIEYTPILNSPQKISYYFNKKLNKTQTYRTFCIILSNSLRIKNKKDISCKLKIGKEDFKIMGLLHENEGISSYLIQHKDSNRKYVLEVNTNGIPNDSQVKSLLKMQDLLSTHSCKHILKSQRFYLNIINKDNKKYMDTLVLIREYVDAKSLKNLLNDNNSDPKVIRKALLELCYFIIEISKQGIILKNLNLENTIVLNQNKKGCSIRIVGGKISTNSNNIKCLTQNIENLKLLWYWYKNAPSKEGNNSIDTLISRDKMPLIQFGLGKISGTKIEELAKSEKNHMPKNISNVNISLFHTFILTLLEIYNDPRKFMGLRTNELNKELNMLFNKIKRNLA